VIGAFTFIASFVTWYAIKATMGLRVSEEEELEGIDEREFGMHSYPEFVKLPGGLGYSSSATV